MRLLGIDYGRKKMGLAISAGNLAEPLKVLKDAKNFVNAIQKLIEEEDINAVIVGISENKMAEETYSFSKLLEKKITVPVHTHDETLSTSDAKRMSIEGGVKQRKRRKMEDAYAACVMLQSYLDTKEIAS